jgi:hypothetical protein
LGETRDKKKANWTKDENAAIKVDIGREQAADARSGGGRQDRDEQVYIMGSYLHILQMLLYHLAIFILDNQNFLHIEHVNQPKTLWNATSR